MNGSHVQDSNRRRRLLVIAGIAFAAVVVVALVISRNHDLHASPSGLDDHLPGNSANAPGNQAGGACSQLSSTQIATATGGSVTVGSAANLTPGVDRCNWTITKSRLSPAPVELALYRPASTGSARRTAANLRGLKTVVALGPGATYDAVNMALSYQKAGRATVLQLITPARVKLSSGRALSSLVDLARAQ